MKGHDHIISQRMNGRAPAFVFVNDYPCKTDWFDFGEHATVCTHGDNLATADFRFLTGLRVSISATTEARAKDLFRRIKLAGANAVAACHITDSLYPQAGWCDFFDKEAVNA